MQIGEDIPELSTDVSVSKSRGVLLELPYMFLNSIRLLLVVRFLCKYQIGDEISL